MALKVGELFASMNLKDEGFTKGLGDAESMMNKTAGNIKKSSDSMFKSLLKADIFKKAAGAVLNAGKSIMQVGQSFEAMMSEVGALSGASVEELNRMEEAAKEYGATTAFSASQAAEAMKYMALAGWDTEKTLEGLPGVLNLAAASGMDLAAASDAVTDYLSAFGMAASEAGKMADMMAYAQANSNTSAQALSDAYGNCASSMHAAGQDIETTTAMLMLLADQGVKGSEAGTAMSAVMRDMTQKMENGSIKIGKTAVAVQDAQGNFRDLNDIMQDVEKATEGMGSAAKQAALMETFTARSIKAVNMVMSAGTGKFNEYEKALRGAAGTGADQANKMLDNLQGDIKLFVSAMEGLQLELYDILSDTARNYVQGGSQIVQALMDGVKSGFSKASLDRLLGGSFKLMDAIGKNIRNAIKGLPKFFSDIGKLMGPFAKELIGMVGEAVGTFVASLPQLAPSILEGFIQLFAGVTSGITEAFKNIFLAMTGQLEKGDLGVKLSESIGIEINTDEAEGEIETAKRTVSTGLKDAFEYVRRTLTGEVEGNNESMANAATKLVNEKLAGLYKQVGAWQDAKVEEIKASDLGADEMSAAIAEIEAQADDMRAQLASSRGEAEAWLDQYASAPADIVNEHYGELEGILDSVDDVEKVTSKYAEAIGDSVEEQSFGEQIFEHLFGDVDLTSVEQVFSGLGETIGNAINTGLTAAGIGVTGIISMITSGLDKITDEDFATNATAVAGKVITSIGNGFANVTNKVSMLAVKIIEGIGTSLDKIESGGTILTSSAEGVANAIFDAIVNGFDAIGNGAALIINAVGGLLSKALDAMNDDDFVGGLTSLGQTIVQGIGESLRKAGETGVDILDAITKVINEDLTPEKIAGALTNIGNFVQGIWDAISGEMTKTDDSGRTLLDAFADMIGAAFSTLSDSQVTTALGDFASKFVAGLQAAVGDLADDITGIFNVITAKLNDAITADSVSTALTNANNFVQGLWNAINDALTKTGEDGKTLVSSFVELVGAAISTLGSDDVSKSIGTFGKTFIIGLGEAIKTAGSSVGSIIDGITEILSKALQDGSIAKVAENLGNLGIQVVKAIAEAIKKAASGAGDIITAIGDLIGTALTGADKDQSDSMITILGGLGEKIIEALKIGIEGAQDAAGTLMTAFIGKMLEIDWGKALTDLGTVASNLITKLGEAIGSAFTHAGDIVDGITTMIQNAMKETSGVDLGSSMLALGTQILTAIAEGIKSAVTGGATLITSIAELISTLIESAVTESADAGIESEADSAFGAIGSTIVDALATGISKVGDAATTILTELSKKLDTIDWDTIATTIATMAHGFVAKLAEKIGAEDFSNVIETIGTKLGEVSGKLVGAAAKIVGELIKSMLDPALWLDLANGITAVLRGAVEGILTFIDEVWAKIFGKSPEYQFYIPEVELPEEIKDFINWNDNGTINVQASINMAQSFGETGTDVKIAEMLKEMGILSDYETEYQQVVGITLNPELEDPEAQMAAINEYILKMLGESGATEIDPNLTVDPESTVDDETATIIQDAINSELEAAGITTEAPVDVKASDVNSDPAVQAATAAVEESMRAGLTEDANALGTEFSTEIATAIENAESNVTSAATSVGRAVTSAVRNAMPVLSARNIGYNFSIGLANGILQGKSLVIEAAKKVAQEAVKAAKEELDIKSPSRVTYQIGQYFSQGFANGITNGLQAVRTVASGMASTASNALSQSVQSRSAASESASVSAGTSNFDYDRLETIIRGLNMVMIANDKVMAQVTAKQNQMQNDSAAKRLALATGRR